MTYDAVVELLNQHKESGKPLHITVDSLVDLSMTDCYFQHLPSGKNPHLPKSTRQLADFDKIEQWDNENEIGFIGVDPLVRLVQALAKVSGINITIEFD